MKCSGWLGSPENAEKVEPSFIEATDEFKWDIWAANTLGSLIAQAPYQHSPLPRETIKKALVLFVNKCSNCDVIRQTNSDFTLFSSLELCLQQFSGN